MSIFLKYPVILCGFMASGKSTIGAMLSERLRVPFKDTDTLITEKAGKTIPEIFADDGEAAFRDLEYDIALQIVNMPPCIVSTGGGMLTFDRNGEVLASSGTIICLQRDFETTYGILSHDKTRPMVFSKSRDEILKMYDTRMSRYKKYAAVIIDNDDSKADCVDKIIEYLKNAQASGR